MNDSSVVVAVILDKEGLRHWQNRMIYLTTAKPEHGARMLRLDHAFQSAEAKQLLYEAGVIWTLTDEQFKIFLEKTVTTEHSRRILDGLTAQNAATATPQAAGAAAQARIPPAPTTQENGAWREQDEGNGTRVSG